MKTSLALIFLLTVGVAFAQDTEFTLQEPTGEHDFLKRFVGEWECNSEMFMDPDQAPVTSKGELSGRMIGNFWINLDLHGEAMGAPYHGQALFGFDARNSKKYIGSWADSMSDFLWRYEGRVDGNKLILDSEGPDPMEPGKMMKARDSWEFKGKDQVILTSEMEMEKGKMTLILKCTCTRKK